MCLPQQGLFPLDGLLPNAHLCLQRTLSSCQLASQGPEGHLPNFPFVCRTYQFTSPENLGWETLWCLSSLACKTTRQSDHLENLLTKKTLLRDSGLHPQLELASFPARRCVIATNDILVPHLGSECHP